MGQRGGAQKGDRRQPDHPPGPGVTSPVSRLVEPRQWAANQPPGPRSHSLPLPVASRIPPPLPGKAFELRSGPGLLDGLGLGWQISGQPAATFGAFCPCCRISMCQGCPAARTAGPATRRQWADAKPADPRRLQRKPPAEDGKCRTMRPVVIPGAGVTGACPKTVSCRV